MILVFSSNELDFLILQNGKDGVSADSKYTWVKYSQNADGSNLTDNPSGAIYIGIAYNMESREESNDPSDYSWTKIKGENGEDAYTIILGNENISFSVGYDSNTVLSDQSHFSTVQIMQGVTERTDFTIGSVSSANGITITKNDQNKTLVLSVHEGDTITADSGYFRIPISIDGLIFFKDLSWNLTKQGRPGDVGHPGEGAINVIVANESQTIACTNDGLTSGNALINIPFVAFKGLEKVPCSAIVGVLPSGITLGSNTSSTADEDGLIIFNVAAKSDLGGANILSGYVNLTFTVEDQTIIKRFIWTKTKDGKDGNTYTLELSSVIINKNYDGTISPTSITLRAYYQNRNERIPYAGRFIIAQSYFDDISLTDENKNILVDENNNLLLFQEGSDGYTSSGYQNVYVSSQNESEYTHTLPPLVSGVICYLCEADSVTNILDQQTVTVLTVADDIKPIITEITTTMSGVSQKVDAVEKSITDKVWQTDITNALNNYDGTTIKTLRDQVSQINISIDGITSEVSDVKSTLTTKADGSVVQELSEKVSKVEQDAEGFKQTVEENYVTNDKLDENSKTLRSEFNQTASEINQSVTDLSGNVTSITQDVTSIKQRVTDAEGNISSLEQSSENLKSQIENAQGDISSIQQTAKGLQSQITDNKNNISQLDQDVEGFKTTVSSQLGALESTIEQTAQDIELSVSEVADNLKNNYYNKTQTDALIKVEADKITSTVSRVETVETTLKKTVKSNVEEFYLSTSHTALSGGSWSTTQPTWTDGKYIWRRTKVTYTDGTTSYTPSTNGVCITGNTGSAGTSVTVKSTVTDYQVSSSGTTVPTGSWTTSIPTVSAGKYLWTRVRVTYSDNKVATSYSVARQGQNGTNGSDGKGIKSTSITYQAHSSQTSTPTGIWSSSVPTLSTAKPYLWTRTIITYTDNSTSTSYSVSSTLESFEVGGRNLVKYSSYDNLSGTNVRGNVAVISIDQNEIYDGRKSLKIVADSESVSGSKDIWQYLWNNTPFTSSTTCTVSFYVKGVSGAKMFVRVGGGAVAGTSSYDITISDEWTKVERTWANANNASNDSFTTEIIYGFDTAGTYYINGFKLELGNKATDWSPAPEDMATAEEVQNAQTAADNAQSTADSTESRVTVAESTIQQLSDSIAMLVVDENGESMMTQTSDGWRFDMGSINSQLNDAKDQLGNLAGTVNQVGETIGNLNDLANDLSEKTAYITMTTDDSDKPCIELGKSDNDFKVRITNTSIDFMEGSSRIAYLSNRSLYIETAIIRNELQIGEGTGYVWKKRSNNHMGLRWLGG